MTLINENGSGSNPDDDDLKWFSLSSDENAFDLLMENPNKIVWREFCRNQDPRAFAHLLRNPEKIEWDVLRQNPYYILFNMVDSLKDLQAEWEHQTQPTAQ